MHLSPRIRLLLLACVAVVSNSAAYGVEKRIPCTDSNLALAPYVWKCTGTAAEARAEAALPGAYLKAMVRDTKTLGLVIDGTVNQGCPASSMPVIETSVDAGPFAVMQLTRTDAVYTLPIAQSLDPTVPHTLEVYFRAADLAQKRWTASIDHLCLAGLALDETGTLTPCPLRPKRAIGFGDSITEGVGVDALFSSWQSLGPNNARGSWFPLVCAALDCEYGQLGSGGQGMLREFEMPALPKTWDRYDPATSRLKDGLLLPEPDYIFCCMGTNDYNDIDIVSTYTEWLSAVRKACPHATIFCVVPPAGLHRKHINAVVATRKRAHDSRVYVIDIPELNRTMPAKPPNATQMTYDSAHPTLYGQAVFGACVAVRAQALLHR